MTAWFQYAPRYCLSASAGFGRVLLRRACALSPFGALSSPRATACGKRGFRPAFLRIARAQSGSAGRETHSIPVTGEGRRAIACAEHWGRISPGETGRRTDPLPPRTQRRLSEKGVRSARFPVLFDIGNDYSTQSRRVSTPIV